MPKLNDMYFKSLSDLTKDIHEWIPSVQVEFDCVVGIPRSGMLVANILALKWGVPFVDLDGFLEGRILGLGRRYRHIDQGRYLDERRKVLIVDDSISSGGAMAKAKDRIVENECVHDLSFMAVYVTKEAKNLCDYYVQLVPNPRRFEWNILSSRAVGNYCFDMDGVLCNDPTPEENDDGENYLHFIKNAKPLYVPAYPIGMIVTSRLEKYRRETESWLERNGVSYRSLRMLELAKKEDRISLKAAVPFKARVYKESGCDIFIESDIKQAVKIAEISNKYVYSVDVVQMLRPGALKDFLGKRKYGLRKVIRKKLSLLKRKLMK